MDTQGSALNFIADLAKGEFLFNFIGVFLACLITGEWMATQ